MAEKQKKQMTLEGFKKLEERYEFLKTVRRKEVSERIKTAIGFGDLSENAEYDEAKNEQAQLEEEIYKLEQSLANAEVVDENELTLDKVSVGLKVVVKDLEFDEEEEFIIVGTSEADPYENKISNESPVGEALIGREVGDVVDVQVPDGMVKFEIIEIKR